MQISELAIGILAGGKSSRMGSDKARLRYGDNSFLEYLLSQAEAFGERLLSVDKIRNYRWLMGEAGAGPKRPEDPFPVFVPAGSHGPVILAEDEREGFGPVEGIYQILRRSRKDACLIVATDMPGLTEEFFQAFAGAYRGEDCLVLRAGGALEPLCSIYGKNCIPVLGDFRREGIRRPRLLFERVDARYLDIEALGCAPDVVSNINTPDEYRDFMDNSRNASDKSRNRPAGAF